MSRLGCTSVSPRTRFGYYGHRLVLVSVTEVDGLGLKLQRLETSLLNPKVKEIGQRQQLEKL